MSRSKWKGPYLNNVELKTKKITTTQFRNTEIMPSHINKTFKIYNGKKYKEISTVEEMLGHKFGEFFFTRAKFVFKKKKSKKK